MTKLQHEGLFVCLFVNPLHHEPSQEFRNAFKCCAVTVLLFLLSSWQKSNGTPTIDTGHGELDSKAGEDTETETFLNILF